MDYNKDEYAAVFALTRLGSSHSASLKGDAQDESCEPEREEAANEEAITKFPVLALTHLGNHSEASSKGETQIESCGPEREEAANEEAITKFPIKLFDILHDHQYLDIVRWLPDGGGFYFIDKKRFESEVLPLFFKKYTKFTSFTRRLIRWGFVRVPKGPFIGSYFHFLFHRDKRSLCIELCTRLRNKPAAKPHPATYLTQQSVQDEANGSENESEQPVAYPPTSVSHTLGEKRALFSAYYAHKVHQEQLSMTRQLFMLRLIEHKRRRVIENHYLAFMQSKVVMQGDAKLGPAASNDMMVTDNKPKKTLFSSYNAFAA